MTLREQLQAAGLQTDTHESDLYVEATRKAREIVLASGRTCTTFIDQISGKPWLDVPFANEAFWLNRCQQAKVSI